MVGGANRILRIPSNDSRLTDPMGPWGPSWKMGGLPSGRRRSWSSALQMVPLWAWNSMALSTKATRLAIEYWIARTCLSSQGFVLSGYLEIWWFGTSFQDFHKHCIKWQFWVYHFFFWTNRHEADVNICQPAAEHSLHTLLWWPAQVTVKRPDAFTKPADGQDQMAVFFEDFFKNSHTKVMVDAVLPTGFCLMLDKLDTIW